MKSIFVSSTYVDLINERNQAIETIDSLDSAKAIAMERISPNSNPSKETCLSNLRKCHLVILILGFKYGSEDPEENISITEIEYNEAKLLNLPVLVFIKNNSEGKWMPDENVEEIKEKLEKFKKRLDSERTRVTFQQPEELGQKIAIAIHNYESENGEIGIHNPQFLTGESFFKPFLIEKNAFNHCHPFFGRTEIFQKASDFIGSKKKILIIQGRGGIGKSKLLYELYKKYSSGQKYKIWFLSEDAQFSEDTYRQIPFKEKNIIIVDDAHRQNNLKNLFKIAIEYPDSIQLVFSLRNYGVDYLKAQSLQNGFDPSDLEILPEILSLKRKDLEDIADSILDENHKEFRDSLINVARDSPLVLVIGAKLVNENSIHPKLLSTHKDFEDIVFRRFSDILIGDLSDKFDENDVKTILRLFSAIQPVNYANSELLKMISEFVGIETDELISIISELEFTGVLLNNKYAGLRITPDVFSDYILSEACVTRGRLTGYADRVFDTFYAICPREVISNIAELDWRVQSDGTAIDVIGYIWERIFNDFKQGSNRKRYLILTYLEKNAYQQPSKSLDLIDFALSNPSSDNENITGLREYNHTVIKSVIPKILQNISYYVKYLPKCCDILWDLGKDKEGDLSSDTDHPIRILQDLAQYNSHKSPIIQSIILDAVERWVQDSPSYHHLYSPLDVIDPMLKKDGEDIRLTGHKIEIRPFYLNYLNLQDIRKRALSLIALSFTQNSTRICLRAMKSLREMLHPPGPLFGREISEDEYAQWFSEEKDILEIFEDIVVEIHEPVILIKIKQNLRWYLEYGRDVSNRQKSEQIINKIQETFELSLDRGLLFSFDEKDHSDYTEMIEEKNRKIQQTIKEFISKIQSCDEAYSILNDRIQFFKAEKIPHNPGCFFYLLGNLYPKQSENICKIVLADCSSSLAQYYGTIVSGIIKSEKIIAKQLINEGIQSQRNSICRSIAFGYSNGFWQREIDNDELSFIEELLKFPDNLVKEYAISALAKFSKSEDQKIKEIALNFDIENNFSLADALFSLFYSTSRKPGLESNKSEIEKMMLKLKPIPSLNGRFSGKGAYICNFFRYVCENNPDVIISLFIERIQYANENEGEFWDPYEPIPNIEFSRCIENLYGCSDYKKLLISVCDVAHQADKKTYYRDLFEILSNNYSLESLKILDEWSDSDIQNKISIVFELIQNSPPEFLIENYEFINKILESSSKISDSCLNNAKNNLYRIAALGSRSGTVGEPFPLDIKIKNGAEECANKFHQGSITEIFYRELVKRANGWIEDRILDDKEMY